MPFGHFSQSNRIETLLLAYIREGFLIKRSGKTIFLSRSKLAMAVQGFSV